MGLKFRSGIMTKENGCLLFIEFLARNLFIGFENPMDNTQFREGGATKQKVVIGEEKVAQGRTSPRNRQPRDTAHLFNL